MSPNTRGWLMALGSIAALALVVQLTMDPLKKKPIPPPPAPPAPSVSTAPSSNGGLDGGAVACDALEKKYATLGEKAIRCSTDDDCTIEERDKSWFGLDDCFRVGSKRAKNDERDAVAATWKKSGCVDPGEYEQCPVPPKVRCSQGICGERPPAPLPIDWKRHVVRHLLRTWLPPEMTQATPHPVPGETIVDVTDGDGSTLTISLRHAPKITEKNAIPTGLIAATKKIKIDGRPAMLFYGDDRATKLDASASDRLFHTHAGLDDVNDGKYGSGMHLDFEMTCTSLDKCGSLAQILANTNLYVLFDTPHDH